jgi:hypothetical protein
MRSILASALMIVFGAAIARGDDHPKLQVATIKLESINNMGINYESLQLLTMDKETRNAFKKINVEKLAVQKEIINAEDELKLADLGRKLEFLDRKLNLLRQRTMNLRQSRDIQAHFRDFVIAEYKGKYQLILQDRSAMSGRPEGFLWKGNAEFTDITSEATEKFKERISEMSGDNIAEESKEADANKETPKFKVATLQIDRILNAGIDLERLRSLSADKDTLEAIQKIRAEIKGIQKEIANVEEEEKLAELGKKLGFLNNKSSLLVPRLMNNPMIDLQAMLRRIAIDHFKDGYSMIQEQSMQDPRSSERILWKNNVTIDDITEDVREYLKDFMDSLPDLRDGGYPVNQMPSRKAIYFNAPKSQAEKESPAAEGK